MIVATFAYLRLRKAPRLAAFAQTGGFIGFPGCCWASRVDLHTLQFTDGQDGCSKATATVACLWARQTKIVRVEALFDHLSKSLGTPESFLSH